MITPAPVRKEIHTSDFYGMYDEESVRKSELLDQEYHRALKDMKEVYFLNAGEIAEVSKRDCIHSTEEGHAARWKSSRRESQGAISIMFRWQQCLFAGRI